MANKFTSIKVHDEIRKQAKFMALQQDISLGKLIDEALECYRLFDNSLDKAKNAKQALYFMLETGKFEPNHEES